MTNTTWTPDTCDCKIEYNPNGNWVNSKDNCRLHKRLNGQIHLDTVRAQNKRFNNAIQNPNILEEEEIRLTKEVNKLRIRVEDLTNFHEHLPKEHPLTFIQNLRRLLRLNPPIED